MENEREINEESERRCVVLPRESKRERAEGRRD